jgi:hypothetical protein
MGLEAISASTISIVFVGTLVPIIFLIDLAPSHSQFFRLWLLADFRKNKIKKIFRRSTAKKYVLLTLLPPRRGAAGLLMSILVNLPL